VRNCAFTVLAKSGTGFRASPTSRIVKLWLAVKGEFPMPRVLVVDDEKDVRAVISMVLRVRQFEVIEAASAAAGIAAFEQSSFDAAIVDIFLADTNGFDLIAALRERAPHLPVVAISGIATGGPASPAVADMANVATLQKPFRPNDLIKCTGTCAGADGAHRKERQLPGLTRQPIHPASPIGSRLEGGSQDPYRRCYACRPPSR
jgi:CheY-like chemotaxis protein